MVRPRAIGFLCLTGQSWMSTESELNAHEIKSTAQPLPLLALSPFFAYQNREAQCDQDQACGFRHSTVVGKSRGLVLDVPDAAITGPGIWEEGQDDRSTLGKERKLRLIYGDRIAPVCLGQLVGEEVDAVGPAGSAVRAGRLHAVNIRSANGRFIGLESPGIHGPRTVRDRGRIEGANRVLVRIEHSHEVGHDKSGLITLPLPVSDVASCYDRQNPI